MANPVTMATVPTEPGSAASVMPLEPQAFQTPASVLCSAHLNPSPAVRERAEPSVRPVRRRHTGALVSFWRHGEIPWNVMSSPRQAATCSVPGTRSQPWLRADLHTLLGGSLGVGKGPRGTLETASSVTSKPPWSFLTWHVGWGLPDRHRTLLGLPAGGPPLCFEEACSGSMLARRAPSPGPSAVLHRWRSSLTSRTSPASKELNQTKLKGQHSTPWRAP